jgi:transcriptional regulator of nitric oxide reductase
LVAVDPSVLKLAGNWALEMIRNQQSILSLPLTLFWLLLGAAAASAQTSGAFDKALKAGLHATIFPGADRVGAYEGNPPSAVVYRNGGVVGYLFVTSDVVNSAGYSGKPFSILAGLDLNGTIAGAVVIAHQEPILVLGIKDTHLARFVAQFAGLDVTGGSDLKELLARKTGEFEMIAQATITSLVFADSVIRAGRQVARDRGIMTAGQGSDGGGLDYEKFEKLDWRLLLEGGLLRALTVTTAQVDTAFRADKQKPESSEKVFLAIYGGLATPALVGQNLLGFTAYNKLLNELPSGSEVLFLAGAGLYSFRGYRYRRTGVFDRLQLVQGGKVIPLRREMHRSVAKLAIDGAPELRERSLFVLDKDSGFDATKPWQFEILVRRPGTDGGEDFAGFALDYRVPAALLIAVEDDLKKFLWRLWERRQWEILMFAALATALTGTVIAVAVRSWAVNRRERRR